MVEWLDHHHCIPDISIDPHIPQLSISISVLRMIVPVLCCLTSPPAPSVWPSFLAVLIFPLTSFSPSIDVESLLLKSSSSTCLSERVNNIISIQWLSHCDNGRAGQSISSFISLDARVHRDTDESVSSNRWFLFLLRKSYWCGEVHCSGFSSPFSALTISTPEERQCPVRLKNVAKLQEVPERWMAEERGHHLPCDQSLGNFLSGFTLVALILISHPQYNKFGRNSYRLVS